MLWLLLDYSSVYIILKLCITKGTLKRKKELILLVYRQHLDKRKLGVDLGPTAIRYAGLIPRLKQLDLDVNDKGDIKVSVVDIEKFQSEQKD